MTGSSDETTRPVVALDIDGVLNPIGDDTDCPGFVPYRVQAPAADVPDSPFIRGGGSKPMDVTVRLHPDHGPWITSLLEFADVVWATTWESAANLYIAPLLGIQPLPLGLSVAGNPPRFGHMKSGDTGAWKADALAENFPGRPLAWADDLAGTYTRDSDRAETTKHLVTYRDERMLGYARTYGWENRIVPAAHYEDTWAEHGFLMGSDWSTIAHGASFRRWRGDLAPTMVVNTAAPIGLTPEQMDSIGVFVREHATTPRPTEGQS